MTDAAQDSASYREFADGPFLTAKAMAWFWDAYLPQRDQRGDITASPLRASREQLAGLPPALVIVDENDVLRDEGEAYARQLIQAGVPTTSVRYNAIIHDFMMLNPVRAHAGGDSRHRAGDPRPAQGARDVTERRSCLPPPASRAALGRVEPGGGRDAWSMRDRR